MPTIFRSALVARMVGTLRFAHPNCERACFTNFRIVPTCKRNKPLAIPRIEAHNAFATERPSAFVGGENASVALPLNPDSGAPNMPVRRSPKQSATFEYRLAQEAINLRQQAKGMPLGIRRTELLQKARQFDVAGEINEWLTSPGLQPPS